MAKKDHGLIGKLYYDVFPDNTFAKLNNSSRIKHLNPRDYFQEEWLGISKFREEYWTEMITDDVFRNKQRAKTQTHISNTISFEEKIKSDLDLLCKKSKNSLDKYSILDNLVDALEKAESFRIPTGKKAGVHPFDNEAKTSLIKHINTDRELFELPHFIRLYISFAVNNTVPDDFSYNERTEKDLEEFSKYCIRKFGTSSKHGIMEIIRLAKRANNPNVIAINEYADILYYGKVDGIEQDINEAFKYYKLAAGSKDADTDCLNLYSNAYPLALWSVGHILFNYKNPRVNRVLSEDVSIPELDNYSTRERIEEAYKRASQAYSISKVPAAANLIGQIAQLTDKDNDDYIGIDAFKEKKKIQDCKYYFELAKEGGWVYAYNMLANEELRQLAKNINNKNEWHDHISNYLMNLHEAAVRGEPWAANTLGLAFLEGIKYRDPATKETKVIIDSEGVKTVKHNKTINNYGTNESITIINPKTRKQTAIDNIINPELAYSYFMMAYKSYHVFHDRYCGWACANLMSYFSDRLSEEEKNDIESIINEYSYVDEIVKTASVKRQLPSVEALKKK